MIGAVLGDNSISASDLSLGQGNNATADFTWTYNNDVFYLGAVQTALGTLSTFDDGDVIFQFVDAVGGMNASDISVF